MQCLDRLCATNHIFVQSDLLKFKEYFCRLVWIFCGRSSFTSQLPDWWYYADSYRLSAPLCCLTSKISLSVNIDIHVNAKQEAKLSLG